MVLDTIEAPTDPVNCDPKSGKVRVCNAEYGTNTGWLGVATVWAVNNHITQGRVKLNDSYYNDTNKYDNFWRLGTLCQEVGHTVGLDHQSENTSVDMNTCMDYYNQPDEANAHPNQHDYEQLDTLYKIDKVRKTFGHADSTTTIKRTTPRELSHFDTEDPREWGQLVHTSANRKVEIYKRNFGNGHEAITRVIRP